MFQAWRNCQWSRIKAGYWNSSVTGQQSYCRHASPVLRRAPQWFAGYGNARNQVTGFYRYYYGFGKWRLIASWQTPDDIYPWWSSYTFRYATLYWANGSFCIPFLPSYAKGRKCLAYFQYRRWRTWRRWKKSVYQPIIVRIAFKKCQVNSFGENPFCCSREHGCRWNCYWKNSGNCCSLATISRKRTFPNGSRYVYEVQTPVLLFTGIKNKWTRPDFWNNWCRYSWWNCSWSFTKNIWS